MTETYRAQSPTVIGIAAGGGVPVAEEVARAPKAPLHAVARVPIAFAERHGNATRHIHFGAAFEGGTVLFEPRTGEVLRLKTLARGAKPAGYLTNSEPVSDNEICSILHRNTAYRSN